MMTSWYVERTPDRPARAVIAVTLLALLLVAAVPVALLAGAVMMMLGHVVGGLALFGGSVLGAVIAVALAGMTGVRHLRKLVSGRGFRVVQLDGLYADVAEPAASGHATVVRLDGSQYTDVAEPAASGHATVVRLDGSQYTDVAEPAASGHATVVQLDRSQYTEVR